MTRSQPSLAFLLASTLVLTNAPVRAGTVYISGDDSDDITTTQGHCRESNCGQLMGTVLTNLYEGCGTPPAAEGILAIGTHLEPDGRTTAARAALIGGTIDGRTYTGWLDVVNNGPGIGTPVTHCNDVSCIVSVNFSDYRVLYVASHEHETNGGLTQAQLDVLNLRKDDIKDWVNAFDGRILALTEEHMDDAYGWLPDPLMSEEFPPGCMEDVEKTPDPDVPGAFTLDLEFPGHFADGDNLDHRCYHNYFTGPAGWSGLSVLIDAPGVPIVDPEDEAQLIAAPVALGCCRCKITAEDCDDGVDNDGDTLVDEQDEDCHLCGDGTIDPIDRDGDGIADEDEECDDGNNVDGDGCSADCLLENEPPTCALTGPHFAECEGAVVAVALDGSASSDPDGDPLDFRWATDCPMAAFDDERSPRPTLTLTLLGPPPCPSTCQVTLTVSDGNGESDTCTTTITVDDTRAPRLVGVPDDDVLQCPAVPTIPPVTAEDDCDATPRMDVTAVRTPGGCPDEYTVTHHWTATDACGNAVMASQSVSVVDVTPPIPVALLIPLLPEGPTSPASPLAPSSACSAASSGAFRVACAATDDCDPNPALEAVLLVRRTVPDAAGDCMDTVEQVPVPCGELVELRRAAPPCSARSVRSAAPAAMVTSDGRLVVTGEDIVLRVFATDRCGNTAAADDQLQFDCE